MDALAERLGYQFGDADLLVQALTHPSIAAERKDVVADNQRLEFLGDAVLQVILTEHLFRVLPEEAEGHLTKTRATLVSRRALAECARRVELGSHLRLGKGEEANGGRERESNLADAFEALLGAIYLDGGIKSATAVTMRVMEEDLQGALEGDDTSNPKGRLQEVLQALRRESPSYRILAEEGPDHLKQFKAEVIWCGMALGEGRGSSKKNAESAAAEDALEGRRWEHQAVSSGDPGS
jgi:ribonuclease-3